MGSTFCRSHGVHKRDWLVRGCEQGDGTYESTDESSSTDYYIVGRSCEAGQCEPHPGPPLYQFFPEPAARQARNRYHIRRIWHRFRGRSHRIASVSRTPPVPRRIVRGVRHPTEQLTTGHRATDHGLCKNKGDLERWWPTLELTSGLRVPRR